MYRPFLLYVRQYTAILCALKLFTCRRLCMEREGLRSGAGGGAPERSCRAASACGKLAPACGAWAHGRTPGAALVPCAAAGLLSVAVGGRSAKGPDPSRVPSPCAPGVAAACFFAASNWPRSCGSAEGGKCGARARSCSSVHGCVVPKTSVRVGRSPLLRACSSSAAAVLLRDGMEAR